MKQKTPKIMTKWNTIEGERLIDAFMVATKRPDIMRLFLDDLMTESELDLCIRRFQAVYMLSIGTPYSYVSSATGLSSATIARISKQMCNRRNGYGEIMFRLYPNGIRYHD